MAVPSTSTGADKASLRRHWRDWRRAYAAELAPDTRAALEAELARILQPLLFAATVVAAYQPMKDEISPLPALELARSMGKQTAFPAFVARDSRMTFRGGEASEPGPWGLLQPPLDQRPLVPDLVLIPLVACDSQGNRIGMGKGHYDRALAALRPNARLVGLGWEEQLLQQSFEADLWDQPLDAFASPAGLTEFAR